MMYSIYKMFCFLSMNFTLKMLPEKWKLEVSVKSRTNSNLQAVLCGCHHMRLLQALVYIKAPFNAYPAAKSVLVQVMF